MHITTHITKHKIKDGKKIIWRFNIHHGFSYSKQLKDPVTGCFRIETEDNNDKKCFFHKWSKWLPTYELDNQSYIEERTCKKCGWEMRRKVYV